MPKLKTNKALRDSWIKHSYRSKKLFDLSPHYATPLLGERGDLQDILGTYGLNEKKVFSSNDPFVNHCLNDIDSLLHTQIRIIENTLKHFLFDDLCEDDLVQSFRETNSDLSDIFYDVSRLFNQISMRLGGKPVYLKGNDISHSDFPQLILES